MAWRGLLPIPCWLLLAVAAAPAAADSGGAVIRGKGPRVHQRGPHHPHPVFVVRDDFPSFGPPSEAPQVVIEVEGDVEITQYPDGSVRIVIERDEDDEEEE